MSDRRFRSPLWLLLVALVAYALLTFATLGPPPPTPNPPGTFAFAAFGDAPYYPWEDWRYPLALQDIDGNDLAFSIHVGDIFWRPCSEERYQRSLRWLDALKRPLIYVPGDNEWTDCWTAQEGGFDPRGRLNRVRQVLYPRPGFSLGRERMPVAAQSANAALAEFVEHVRWSRDGVVFATLHVVGSRNATNAFPGRTSADDEEAARRLRAALDWLHETFAAARTQAATAVVVAFHADPGFDWKPEQRRVFQPLLDAFEAESVAFAKPVLLIHGDSHEFTVDQPLKAGATGEVVANFTRLEVPGSPLVGWVRVVVTPGSTPSFEFEERLVPRWKFW